MQQVRDAVVAAIAEPLAAAYLFLGAGKIRNPKARRDRERTIAKDLIRDADRMIRAKRAAAHEEAAAASAAAELDDAVIQSRFDALSPETAAFLAEVGASVVGVESGEDA